jgi:hypothetical protein
MEVQITVNGYDMHLINFNEPIIRVTVTIGGTQYTGVGKSVEEAIEKLLHMILDHKQ